MLLHKGRRLEVEEGVIESKKVISLKMIIEEVLIILTIYLTYSYKYVKVNSCLFVYLTESINCYVYNIPLINQGDD